MQSRVPKLYLFAKIALIGIFGTKGVNSGMGWLQKSYWGYVQSVNFLRHFFLLIIRLYWGWQLIIVGLGKWTHIQGVIKMFGSLGIPYPHVTAYVVGTLEVLVGVSFILGFMSRIFSLILTIILSVAYATAHKAALATLFTTPTDFIKQEPFLFLYAALVVLCFGPGLFSIDYWVQKKSYEDPL